MNLSLVYRSQRNLNNQKINSISVVCDSNVPIFSICALLNNGSVQLIRFNSKVAVIDNLSIAGPTEDGTSINLNN